MMTDDEITLRDNKILLDYLKELLTDRSNLANSPGPYIHIGKILEKEILKIRVALLSDCGICTITESDLPKAEGPKVNLQSKIYIPVDPNNSLNYVGRILGPEGSTAKCLQQCLGVKIMIRGRGSMRDRKKEEANIGRPNWEHLNDNLHILITTEDYENRAKARLKKATEYINLFLKDSVNGSEKEDKVKQMQLVELSIRKEFRSNQWHLNFNGMSDYGYPSKSNHMLPNVGSMNIGYGCSSPFYPTLQNNQQYGPFPSQYQHTVGSSSRTGQLTNLSHASFSPSSASPGLNATLIFSNGVGPYPAAFSPNSHQSPAGQTIPTALAVPPVNYWSNNPGVSHLSPNYPTHSPFSNQLGDSETQSNHEHSGSNNTSYVTATVMSAVGCDVSDSSHPVFTSSHSNSHQLSRIHEENANDLLIKELGSCNLSSSQEKSVSNPTSSTLVMNVPKSVYDSSSSDMNLGSKNNSTNRRYSEKHSSVYQNKHSGSHNRANLVVVKVGAIDQPTSATSSSSSSTTVDKLDFPDDTSLSNGKQTVVDTISTGLDLISQAHNGDLLTDDNRSECPEDSENILSEETESIDKDGDSTRKMSSPKSCAEDSALGIDDSSLPLSSAPDAAASHSNDDTGSTTSSSADDSDQENN